MDGCPGCARVVAIHDDHGARWLWRWCRLDAATAADHADQEDREHDDGEDDQDRPQHDETPFSGAGRVSLGGWVCLRYEVPRWRWGETSESERWRSAKPDSRAVRLESAQDGPIRTQTASRCGELDRALQLDCALVAAVTPYAPHRKTSGRYGVLAAPGGGPEVDQRASYRRLRGDDGSAHSQSCGISTTVEGG